MYVLKMKSWYWLFIYNIFLLIQRGEILKETEEVSDSDNNRSSRSAAGNTGYGSAMISSDVNNPSNNNTTSLAEGNNNITIDNTYLKDEEAPEKKLLSVSDLLKNPASLDS